jgi:aerobic-type carbon monoxide dehydrogenase small subunit (CoxS/CutS family)
VDEVMAQHVCRCGTYQRIRKAIHQAADRAPENKST